jgi:hypothetical protein
LKQNSFGNHLTKQARVWDRAVGEAIGWALDRHRVPEVLNSVSLCWMAQIPLDPDSHLSGIYHTHLA